MRENGLRGRIRRRFRTTNDSTHRLPAAPNTLNGQFAVDASDQVWAGDITYIRTATGWTQLAVILGLHSRMVVGWALAGHMRSELVEDALAVALGPREPSSGLLHRSDRGSRYASLLSGPPRGERDRGQHESSRPLLRQCGRRELLQDAEAGARARRKLSGSRRGTLCDPRVHRGLRQPPASALVARLLDSVRG